MEKLLVFYNKSSGKDEGEKLARWFQDYVKEKQPELYVELAETGPSIDDAELVKKAEAIEADTLVINYRWRRHDSSYRPSVPKNIISIPCRITSRWNCQQPCTCS